MITIATYEGSVHNIGPDRRHDKRVAVQIVVDGIAQRPTLSLTYEEAARVHIGQRIVVTLTVQE